MRIAEIELKLSGYRIGIAGAGGLGSNCAMALVRAGIKHLVIADFDVVNESNLNRQFYFSDQLGMKKVDALSQNLRRIKPELDLNLIDKKLQPADIKKYFTGCHVVVEAFDLADQKQMLIEAMFDYFQDIPLVVGSGMAGWGMNDLIKTEQHGNLYLIGDQWHEIDEDKPPIGPRVGIVANMQANQVLEILLGKM